mmetsp:Transcript_2001/g.4249  ORF Transcript_2001/g.4249 Transcript_2001/m.4249 type:complete len:89 (-) Transcript_2001:483-749(-)
MMTPNENSDVFEESRVCTSRRRQPMNIEQYGMISTLCGAEVYRKLWKALACIDTGIGSIQNSAFIVVLFVYFSFLSSISLLDLCRRRR